MAQTEPTTTTKQCVDILNTIRRIVGFIRRNLVIRPYKYKNLITVYTQWNPIMTNENYFCVVFTRLKGNLYSLHVHHTTASHKNCSFHHWDKNWKKEKSEHNIMWYLLRFVLIIPKRIIDIKTENSFGKRASFVIRMYLGDTLKISERY